MGILSQWWNKHFNTARQAIRQNCLGNGWCIADDKRERFISGFYYGMMKEVKFRHKATPMVFRDDKISTGEAVGVIVSQGYKAFKMPRKVVRTARIVYDKDNYRFFNADKPVETIFDADFLTLNGDGSATAGWIKR